MTTPSGVPNLPAGALTLENIQSRLQDMTVAAHRARAAARIPSIFDAGTGGNPLSDLSPMGIIAGLFAGFQHIVSNADPADIQGPEDLPGLLTDFIESLPVIGQLVGLAEAILGTYDGDDPVLLQIQALFAPIRELLQLLVGGIHLGFPTPDQVQLGFRRLQNIFSPVHVSRITDAPINLADDPNFELEDSISPVDGWSRDTTKSANGVGASAKVVCDGSLKRLFHRTIVDDVTVGHTYTFAAEIETDSFTTTDVTEIRLSIVEYHGDAMGEIVDVATRSTGSATFVALSGNYTVPSGVTAIGLCFGAVGATGTLWFSALDLHENDKMPTSYVSGLDALLGGFTTAFNQIGDIVNGLIVVPINGAVANFNDWWHDVTAQVNQTGDDVRDTIKNLFNGWFHVTTAVGHPAEVTAAVESIKATIEGGWTVEVIATSSTWTRPYDVDRFIEFWGIPIGSGSGGGAGVSSGTGAPGGNGGDGGRWMALQIDPTTLDATVACTVAAGGAGRTSGASSPDNGGDSSFGSYVSSAMAVTASIGSIVGFYAATDSRPGAGGDGGSQAGAVYGAGGDGGRTPLAPGGNGGSGNGAGGGANGSAGIDAILTGAVRAGGGGGAGGGAGTSGGGFGGDGGFPGGGGGGGGGTFAGPGGNGGDGANGAIVLLYKLNGI